MASRELRYVITGDVRDFNRALSSADRQLDKTEKHAGLVATNLQRSHARLRSALTGIGVAAGVGVTAAIGGAIKQTVEFDRAMRNVNSIAGENAKQYDQLRKSVLGLAGPTAQAPKTLAEGLYDLVSSGFKANDSLKILKVSAVAATAGLTDTATSTKAVAAVLNAYHLRAKDAQKVSDQLFQTVNLGVVNFEDLSTTIGDVLPFAAQLHVGLGQVGAAFTTMTKEGLSSAETATRLKNALVAFIKPSNDMAKAIKATGFESGEALIKAKGFQGALEAVIGTTNGSKEAVATLFPNIRALGGALALTGVNSRSANRDLKGFADTSGATSKVFAEQSKSVSVQWQRLKAQISDASIEIGSKLIPVMSTAVKWLSQFVQGMIDGTGQGGRFRDQLVKIWQAIQPVVKAVVDVGKFLAEHPKLILAAATAWGVYKTKALAAAAAGRLGLASAVAPAGVRAAEGVVAGGLGSKLAAGARGLGGAAIAGLTGSTGVGLALGAGLIFGPDLVKFISGSKSVQDMLKATDEQARKAANGSFPEWRRQMQLAADDAANFGKKGRATADAIEQMANRVEDAVGAKWQGNIRASWKQFERSGSNSVDAVRSTVQRNMQVIRDRIGTDTDAGRQAMAQNFHAAADAVKAQMDRAGGATKSGTAQIRAYLVSALKALGLSDNQAAAKVDHGTLQQTSARVPGQGLAPTRAVGGWVGMPGQRGQDNIPVLLGAGEAVLNRHQQAVVEGMLGDGFLDKLFSRVQTPHYMARGGYVAQPRMALASGGRIPAVTVNVSGAPGALAQRAVNVDRTAAQQIYNQKAAAIRPAAGAPTGAGGAVPAGSARSWLVQALKLTGYYSPGNLSALYGRMMQESGGNPHAINLWDSNAKAGHPSKGLLQTIDGTFNAYKLPGHGDIWNPVDNAAAAVRYMIATYGHIVGPSSTGYARGGFVRRMARGGRIGRDGFLRLAHKIWGLETPLTGSTQPFPKIQFVKDLWKKTGFTGFTTASNVVQFDPLLLNEPAANVMDLILHEFAHVAQKSGVRYDTRLREGGAQAFDQRVRGQISKALGISGLPAFSGLEGKTYKGYLRYVNRHKSDNFILHGQFATFPAAGGGTVPVVVGSSAQRTTVHKKVPSLSGQDRLSLALAQADIQDAVAPDATSMAGRFAHQRADYQRRKALTRRINYINKQLRKHLPPQRRLALTQELSGLLGQLNDLGPAATGAFSPTDVVSADTSGSGSGTDQTQALIDAQNQAAEQAQRVADEMASLTAQLKASDQLKTQLASTGAGQIASWLADEASVQQYIRAQLQSTTSTAPGVFSRI